jgi:hypothetical protein
MATHAQELTEKRQALEKKRQALQQSILTWVAENTLPAATITAAALYVVLRVSYVMFYNRFGVDPEEVGLGYVQVLTQVATGSLVILVFLALQFVSYFWLSSNSERLSERRFHGLLLTQVVGTVTLIIAFSFVNAFSLSASVSTGSTITPPGLHVSSFFFQNILAIRVPRVRVYWIDQRATPPQRWKGSRTLMYLGQAGGVSVFYDSVKKETLRLPTSAVFMKDD